MKNVGATNTFIRIPFIVEGTVIGILAAVFAFLIVWGGYDLFVEMIVKESTSLLAPITGHLLPFTDVALRLLGYFLSAGILVGGVGSALSIHGYLKA